MTLPQRWTAWFDATREAAPHCFLQLATIGPDGARCRTLALRERHGIELWFTTDQRSEKVIELHRQKRPSEDKPRAEACWYDAHSRTQWRFRGPVHFLLPDAEPTHCRRLWDQLDRQDQARFHGPPPGSLYQGPPPAPGADIAEDFSILVLRADNVKVLELSELPHRHWLYQGDGRAKPARLMP